MSPQIQIAEQLWKDDTDRDIFARWKSLPWPRILADGIILLGMLAVSSTFLAPK